MKYFKNMLAWAPFSVERSNQFFQVLEGLFYYFFSYFSFLPCSKIHISKDKCYAQKDCKE